MIKSINIMGKNCEDTKNLLKKFNIILFENNETRNLSLEMD